MVLPFFSWAAWFGNPYLSEVSMTIKAVDDMKQPVSNALVSIGYDQGEYDRVKQPSIDLVRKGLTATNGIFSATEKILNTKVWYSVQKEGWYTHYGKYAFKRNRETKKWDPPCATNTVVLKKIKNPIPMYVKRVNLGVPEYKTKLGFDLDKGDWVTPYGSGIHTDLVALAECDDPKDMFNQNFRMIISFPNEKDGIIADGVYDSNSGSRLRSDHMAPESGYEPEWVQVRHRTKYKIIENNYDSSRKYYFRVRTKLDEHGNIISAQYGKIYGDFLAFTYYLNPTPNDRNVEFDPDKNLFGGRDRFAP